MVSLRALSILFLLLTISTYSFSQQVTTPASTEIKHTAEAYRKGEIDTMIQNNKILILDFNATWCEPCKVMAPIMAEIANENAGRLKIVKVDYDVNRSLSNAMNVFEIPFLQIYVDGKIVQNVIGMIDKQSILDMLPKQ